MLNIGNFYDRIQTKVKSLMDFIAECACGKNVHRHQTEYYSLAITHRVIMIGCIPVRITQ
jgi:hypothetical protein